MHTYKRSIFEQSRIRRFLHCCGPLTLRVSHLTFHVHIQAVNCVITEPRQTIAKIKESTVIPTQNNGYDSHFLDSLLHLS